MLTYRKKPVVVMAEQFFEAIPASPMLLKLIHPGQQHYYVITIHGQETYVADGDWIIRETGTEDRAYPCKPDIFEKTYELVGK